MLRLKTCGDGWGDAGAPTRTMVALGACRVGLTVVFAAGLTLVLRYSDWAKKKYVHFKRRHPKKGAWAEWGLRRASARRREERRKALEAGAQADAGN